MYVKARWDSRNALFAQLPDSAASVEMPEAAREEVERIRNAIGLFGDRDSALAELAMTYHANRAFDDAKVVYEILIDRLPEDPQWKYLIADVYEAESDFESFERSLVEVEAIGVDYGPCLLKLGRIALRKREYDRAESFLKRAIAVLPRERTVYDVLATVYRRIGDNEKRKLVQDAAAGLESSKGGVEDPWLERIYDFCFDVDQLMVRADVAMERERFGEARAILDKTVLLDKDDWKPHALRMHMYLTGEDATAALDSGLKAVSLGADKETAFTALVPALVKAGRAKQAEETVANVLKDDAQNVVLLQLLATAQAAGGDRSRAVASLLRASELDPNSAKIHTDLGALYWEDGQRDLAAARFRRALEIAPGNDESTLYLAQYYYELGRFSEAEPFVEAGLANNPESELLREMSTSFFTDYGTREFSIGAFKNAARLLGRADALSPGQSKLQQSLAQALIRSGEVGEGLKILNRMVEMGTAGPEVLMTLGELLFGEGDRALARRYFAAAIESGSRSPQYAPLVEAARQRIQLIDGEASR